jgi:archaellum biogenesis ATPase FlaH
MQATATDNPKIQARLELLKLLISWFADGLKPAQIHDLILGWNEKNGGLLLSSELMQAADDIWNKIQADKDTTTHLKLSTLSWILSSPSPEYAIDKILIANSLTLITGYSGSFKTFLMLYIISCLLTKEPLFGQYEVSDKSEYRVLWIDEENSGPILKDRFLKIGLLDYPIQFLHYQGVKLDDRGLFDELMNIITAEKLNLVCFDSLIRIHNASENDASEMSGVMQKLREIVNTGATVFCIHHDGKSENLNKKKTARGSSDIVGSVDLILNCEETNGEVILSNPKNRIAEPFSAIKIRLNPDSYKFDFLGHVLPEGAEVLEEIEDVVCRPGSWGVKEILIELKAAAFKIGHEKLRGILSQAVREGVLVEYTALRGKKEYHPKKAGGF